MNYNIDHIVKNIFQEENFEQISVKQLEELVEQYPSFNFAHYMLSKKMLIENAPDFKKEMQKTSLYFTNPFWLQWLIEQKIEQVDEIIIPMESDTVIENSSSENLTDETEIIHSENNKDSVHKKVDIFGLDAYYTIDYFASQGIKVTQEENPADNFGKQLKSFSDWLKTMKKLPQQTFESENDPAQNALIEHFATHSLEQKEVITETMAEVLVKQGKTQRAVELYHKLSLLNPSKNAYFAAKIEQLK
jgi:hypothetical protein